MFLNHSIKNIKFTNISLQIWKPTLNDAKNVIFITTMLKKEVFNVGFKQKTLNFY